MRKHRNHQNCFKYQVSTGKFQYGVLPLQEKEINHWPFEVQFIDPMVIPFKYWNPSKHFKLLVEPYFKSVKDPVAGDWDWVDKFNTGSPQSITGLLILFFLNNQYDIDIDRRIVNPSRTGARSEF